MLTTDPRTKNYRASRFPAVLPAPWRPWQRALLAAGGLAVIVDRGQLCTCRRRGGGR